MPSRSFYVGCAQGRPSQPSRRRRPPVALAAAVPLRHRPTPSRHSNVPWRRRRAQRGPPPQRRWRGVPLPIDGWGSCGLGSVCGRGVLGGTREVIWLLLGRNLADGRTATKRSEAVGQGSNHWPSSRTHPIRAQQSFYRWVRQTQARTPYKQKQKQVE